MGKKILNDPSWNYHSVVRYFKKSENFTKTNPFVTIDKNYHGYDGPLAVTECVPPLEASSSIYRAAQQLGYNVVDYNGKQQLGVSVFQYYTKNGKMFDPDMAFITPIKTRKNLKVLDNSYVTKVKISQYSKRTEGVFFTRDNKTYFARSTKEEILSAGAISSPQILMLSGIGPQDDLEYLGIPVVQNLPVGQILRDHPVTHLVFSSNMTVVPESTEKSIRDFLKGFGSWTRPNFIDASLLVQTHVEKVDNYPDVELKFSNLSNSALTKKLTTGLMKRTQLSTLAFLIHSQ